MTWTRSYNCRWVRRFNTRRDYSKKVRKQLRFSLARYNIIIKWNINHSTFPRAKLMSTSNMFSPIADAQNRDNSTILGSLTNQDTSAAIKFVVADNLQFTQLIIKSFVSFNILMYLHLLTVYLLCATCTCKRTSVNRFRRQLLLRVS